MKRHRYPHPQQINAQAIRDAYHADVARLEDENRKLWKRCIALELQNARLKQELAESIRAVPMTPAELLQGYA